MVTTQEARVQAQQARAALETRQAQIRATKLRDLTRAERQVKTRAQLSARKIASSKLAGQKQQSLGALAPREKEIAQFETEVTRVEQENIRIQKANEASAAAALRQQQIVKFAGTGKPAPPGSFTKAEWNVIQNIRQGRAAQTTMVAKAKALEKVGLSLNTVTQKEIDLLTPKQRTSLEEVRFLKKPETIKMTELPPETIKMTELPPVTVDNDQKQTKYIPKPNPKMVGIGVNFGDEGKAKKDSLAKNLFLKTGIGTGAGAVLDLFKAGGKEVIKQTGIKSDVVWKNFLGLSEKAGRVTEVPEVFLKENKIQFITTESKSGGTAILTPPSILDVDTGRLPPKQNLEIKLQNIMFRYNSGRISEETAQEEIDRAEKKFNLDTSKRRIPSNIIGGAGLGALSVVAAPLALTSIAGGLISTGANIGKVVSFVKANPKAAAISFGSGLLGYGAGSAGTSFFRSVKVGSPTVSMTGKARNKLTIAQLEQFDPSLKAIAKEGKVTATRTYDVTIPTRGKDIVIKVVEFQKDGVLNFFGRKVVKGKVKGDLTLRGESLIKSKGKDGLSNIITRVIERDKTFFGKSKFEISEIIEKSIQKSSFQKNLFSIQEVGSQAKLTRQFNIKNLGKDQSELLFRTALFGKKEAVRLKGNPFSQAEFNAAKELTKSKVVEASKITEIKITESSSMFGEVIGTKNIFDVRRAEQGLGVMSILTPTLKKIRGKAKFEGGIPVSVSKFGKALGLGRIADVSVSPKAALKVSQVLKTKPLTPLSKTFGTPETSLATTLVAIAKKVQKKTVKKQKIKETEVAASTGFTGNIKDLFGRTEGTTTNNIFPDVITRAPPPSISVSLGGSGQPLQGSFNFREYAAEALKSPEQRAREFSIGDLLVKTTGDLKQDDFLIVRGKNSIAVDLIKPQLAPPIVKTDVGLRSGLGTDSIIKSATQTKVIPATSLITSTIQKSALKSSYLFEPTIKTKPSRPRPKLKVPPIPLPSGVDPTAFVRKLAGFRKKGVDVIVGMKMGKQRVLAKNLPPFKAAKKAQQYVDRNIEASYLLKKSGKNFRGKDIKPFNKSKKFRSSRKNPLFVVEHRKFRLDSPGEKRQIKKASKKTKRRLKKK